MVLITTYIVVPRSQFFSNQIFPRKKVQQTTAKTSTHYDCLDAQKNVSRRKRRQNGIDLKVHLIRIQFNQTQAWYLRSSWRQWYQIIRINIRRTIKWIHANEMFIFFLLLIFFFIWMPIINLIIIMECFYSHELFTRKMFVPQVWITLLLLTS